MKNEKIMIQLFDTWFSLSEIGERHIQKIKEITNQYDYEIVIDMIIRMLKHPCTDYEQFGCKEALNIIAKNRMLELEYSVNKFDCECFISAIKNNDNQLEICKVSKISENVFGKYEYRKYADIFYKNFSDRKAT